MLVQRTLHRDRWIAVCFPIQSVSRSTFYIYFTRQRGDLRGTLQKRCWSSGRCTEIGGSRSVSGSTFYIYFTRQRGDLRGTLQKRCWSSGRCTEIGGSRSVSRSSLFPDPHFTFILHANMGSSDRRCARRVVPTCLRKHTLLSGHKKTPQRFSYFGLIAQNANSLLKRLLGHKAVHVSVSKEESTRGLRSVCRVRLVQQTSCRFACSATQSKLTSFGPTSLLLLVY